MPVKQYKHKSTGAKKRQASRVRQAYYEKVAKTGNPKSAGNTTAQQKKEYSAKAMAQGNLRHTMRAEQKKALTAKRKKRK